MNKDSKIAIIGAGPAGISLGLFLEENGYYNYEILEKLDHVGGKCNSPLIRGKRCDMGAILGAPSYDVVLECMKKANIEIDGEKIDAEMRDAFDGSITNLSSLEVRQILKEIKILGQVLEEKYPSYDCVGHLNTHPDLMENFDVFCKMHGLNEIHKIFINPFTSFGYGYLNETPAAYVLKYLDFATLNYFFKKQLWSIKDGTQSIWERVSDILTNYPTLNVDIKKIQREDNKVIIETNLFTKEYDYVIFTSPLDKLHNFMELTKEEESLFSKIQTVDYKVFAVTLKEYPKKTAYVQKNMVRDRAGHCMIYFVKWPEDEKQVVTLYVIADKNQNITTKECYKLLEEDMALYGFKIKDFVLEKDWYYFPHVDSETYKEGFYDKLEALQGVNNTYYAGEIMSFGDMEEVSAYSKCLVNRFFKKEAN